MSSSSSNKLPHRQLGRNGPMVPAMGLGLLGLSAFYCSYKAPTSTIDDNDPRFAILDRALELGQTNWDSSDFYGDSEDLIGAWFRRTGKRDKIFLASKFAAVVDASGYPIQVRGDREYVISAVERSLARLGTPWIDLYYVHRIDSLTPIEETISTLATFVAAGKIRHIGLSEASAATLRRAAAVHPIAAHQIEYSPFSLDIESATTPLLATARELGVATVAYSPLACGFLTGAIRSPADLAPDDIRHDIPRFQGDNFAKNLDIVDRIAEMAKRKGCTSGQLALAWVLAQGEDVLPIPGTTRISALEENMAALEVRLSEEEIAEVRAVGTTVAGSRCSPMTANYAFGDSAPMKKE